MSVNREVPINIHASYVRAVGGKYTPKSNYFMLITELKRYSLIPGQKSSDSSKNLQQDDHFITSFKPACALTQWGQGRILAPKFLLVHMQLQLIMSFVVFGGHF